MEPHPKIVFVDRSRFQPALDLMAGLVDDIFKYGTHLFDSLLLNEPIADSRSTIALMLRHLLEQLDGVAPLVHQNRPEPLRIVIRAVFEAGLNLSYMTESDMDRRTLNYRLANTHRRLAMVERFNPNTTEGRSARAAVASDVDVIRIGNFEPMELATTLRQMTAHPLLADAEAEWQRRKGKCRWYSLGGGPSNLGSLAIHLGRAAQYHFLYREWSATAHADGLLEKVSTASDARAEIPALRNPDDLQMLTFVASAIALRAFSELVNRVIPSEAGRLEIFQSELGPRYLRVGDSAVPLIAVHR